MVRFCAVRVDPGVVEDLPDGGVGDLEAEFREFSLDAAMASPRVFSGHA
jgi:hypothetical protein